MRRSSEVGMLLIALCAISWAISSPSLAFSYTLNIFGNANMDDTIDELDIAYLEDVIAGRSPATEMADANLDGIVDDHPRASVPENHCHRLSEKIQSH